MIDRLTYRVTTSMKRLKRKESFNTLYSLAHSMKWTKSIQGELPIKIPTKADNICDMRPTAVFFTIMAMDGWHLYLLRWALMPLALLR